MAAPSASSRRAAPQSRHFTRRRWPPAARTKAPSGRAASGPTPMPATAATSTVTSSPPTAASLNNHLPGRSAGRFCCGSPGWVVGEPDQELAEIPALQQADERLGRSFQPGDDVLAVFELARTHQGGRHCPELTLALALVADDKALDLDALADDRAEIGAGARARVVVFGDHPAHHHAGEIVEPREDRLLHRAADILEINIDAVGAGAVELGAEVSPMIDRRVEPEIVRDIAAFLRPAGDADDPRAVTLGELSGDRANRARGRRDDHGLAGFGLADVGEADIGGHARHAEDPERGRDRRLGRVELQ